MNFFHHKGLGNHLLQLCPKVVKHSVYSPLKDLEFTLAAWFKEANGHSASLKHSQNSRLQCQLHAVLMEVINHL